MALPSSLCVQVGHKGNIAGSYLWQIRDHDDLLLSNAVKRQQYYVSAGDSYLPKTVIVDQDNHFVANPFEEYAPKDDSAVWTGKSSVVQRVLPKFQPMRKIRNVSISYMIIQYIFIHYLNQKAYHHKSIVKAPKFPSKTWYYGGLSDSELANMEEETLEGLRHFAEICDYVEAVDLFVDLDCDLGVFCERLLQSIRSDYGRSISIPLWMVEQPSRRNLHANNSSLLAQEKANTLTSLSNSLAVARFTEYTDMLIPLTPDELTVTDVLEDIQIPFGIATTYAFRTGDPMISTREWIDGCTGGRLFPICGYESLCFPSTPENGQPDIESFFKTQIDGKSVRDRHSIPINPMMHRRSPVMPSSFRNNVVFTNFTAFRGWSDDSKLIIFDSHLVAGANIYLQI